MPWGVRGMVVSWANRSVGIPSCQAPLRRPAVRRPDPTGQWYARVLDSAGRSVVFGRIQIGVFGIMF